MTPRERHVGLVGVGRMGANMARRLKDTGFTLTAVFDIHQPAALALAAELKIQAAQTAAHVAKASALVITVVSDDAAMRRIYAENDGTSLLAHADGRLFINCATLSPGLHVELERVITAHGGQCRRSLHGQQHSASTARHALSDVRRQARLVRKGSAGA